MLKALLNGHLKHDVFGWDPNEYVGDYINTFNSRFGVPPYAVIFSPSDWQNKRAFKSVSDISMVLDIFSNYRIHLLSCYDVMCKQTIPPPRVNGAPSKWCDLVCLKSKTICFSITHDLPHISEFKRSSRTHF